MFLAIGSHRYAFQAGKCLPARHALQAPVRAAEEGWHRIFSAGTRLQQRCMQHLSDKRLPPFCQPAARGGNKRFLFASPLALPADTDLCERFTHHLFDNANRMLTELVASLEVRGVRLPDGTSVLAGRAPPRWPATTCGCVGEWPAPMTNAPMPPLLRLLAAEHGDQLDAWRGALPPAAAPAQLHSRLRAGAAAGGGDDGRWARALLFGGHPGGSLLDSRAAGLAGNCERSRSRYRA